MPKSVKWLIITVIGVAAALLAWWRFVRHRPATEATEAAAPDPEPGTVLLALESVGYERTPGVTRLIDLLAVLSPNGVSRQVLTDDAEIDVLVQQLSEASLIEPPDGDGTVRMPRFIQNLICDRLTLSTEIESVVTTALHRIDQLTSDVDGSPQRRDLGPELVNHITSLTDRAPEDADVQDSLLLSRIWAGRQLERVDPAWAVSFAAATYSDARRLLGDDHPRTLNARAGLAFAYEAAGSPAEAVPLHEKNVTVWRRRSGVDHPAALTALSNLAGALRAADRFAEAVTHFERTLTDRRRVLGADHPDTLSSASNLAFAYNSVGRSAESIALFEATLAGRRLVLGEDHVDTLLSMRNLAFAYSDVARWAEAITLLELTVSITRRVHGKDHLDTLTSAVDLARFYRAAGSRVKSGILYGNMIGDFREVLHADHPASRALRKDLSRMLVRAHPVMRWCLVRTCRSMGIELELSEG
jgi:tetratricopeptide (TPR) repeat protein